MAKSLRSKAKRHFRAKKREEGVYAATEAARLHRLHMKLKSLTTTEPDEDEGGAEEGAQMETEGGAAPSAGWSPSPFWFAGLGLVDPHDITADSMADFARIVPQGVSNVLPAHAIPPRRSGVSKRSSHPKKMPGAAAGAGDACGLDHLFLDLPRDSGS
ncbi:hypothetical protein ACG7TL_003613 [Trametes sanguinea]